MVLDVPGRVTNDKYVILRDLRFFGNDDSIPCSKGNLATGENLSFTLDSLWPYVNGASTIVNTPLIQNSNWSEIS